MYPIGYHVEGLRRPSPKQERSKPVQPSPQTFGFGVRQVVSCQDRLDRRFQLLASLRRVCNEDRPFAESAQVEQESESFEDLSESSRLLAFASKKD